MEKIDVWGPAAEVTRASAPIQDPASDRPSGGMRFPWLAPAVVSRDNGAEGATNGSRSAEDGAAASNVDAVRANGNGAAAGSSTSGKPGGNGKKGIEDSSQTSSRIPWDQERCVAVVAPTLLCHGTSACSSVPAIALRHVHAWILSLPTPVSIDSPLDTHRAAHRLSSLASRGSRAASFPRPNPRRDMRPIFCDACSLRRWRPSTYGAPLLIQRLPGAASQSVGQVAIADRDAVRAGQRSAEASAAHASEAAAEFGALIEDMRHWESMLNGLERRAKGMDTLVEQLGLLKR